MKHSFHPACLLFPRLSDTELEVLADNIRHNGLLHPIITLNGAILDGRNRLDACKIAGVKPRFKEWDGTGSPLAWVVATNLVRRHLTASQRAVVAFDLLPMLEAEAKERQRQSPGRGKKGAKKLATSSGKASQIAARITKANSAYVEKVKAINRKAPEILGEIKSGRMSVNEAVRLAMVDVEQRQMILAQAHLEPDEPLKRIMRKVLAESAPRAKASSPTRKSKIEIWCGDCLTLMQQRIAEKSIAVVTTSPPYNQGVPYRSYDDERDESEYLTWMADVFAEIDRVLTPDGSLFLVIGHAARKPWTAMRVAEIAGKRFHLQNQIVWVKAITVNGESHGHFNPISGKRFLNRVWESVFHFTKTGKVPLDRLAVGVPYDDARNSGRTGSSLRCGGDVWFIPYDTVHGGEDRGEHPATFPPEVAERCIKLAGMGIVTWAESVNKFFEVTVRIQTERGHKVINNGPYVIVRHPGYVAGILLSVGTALCLGSVWALVPAGLASLLLILRTLWEDQTLQAELTGYKEYTQRVRYKLIPGLL
jgi:site-specific DNA-methyltransferase (adenine-specific)